LRRLSRSRPPLSKHEFLETLAAAGVSEESANAIYDFASRHYPSYLTPYPDDRWQETLHSHREDFEFFIAEWWEDRGSSRTSLQSATALPSDPSLLELGHWFDAIQASVQK
jgi:hypothetical protein